MKLISTGLDHAPHGVRRHVWHRLDSTDDCSVSRRDLQGSPTDPDDSAGNRAKKRRPQDRILSAVFPDETCTGRDNCRRLPQRAIERVPRDDLRVMYQRDLLQNLLIRRVVPLTDQINAVLAGALRP